MPLQRHADGCNNCIWDEDTASFVGPFTPCTYCPGMIEVLTPAPLAFTAPIDGVEGAEAYDWGLFNRQQRIYTSDQKAREERAGELFGRLLP